MQVGQLHPLGVLTSGPTAAMLAAMDDNPRHNVPTLLTTFVDRWKSLAWGRPGAQRLIQPMPLHDREHFKTHLLDLVEKVAARALEKGSMAERERYVRYWQVYCGLLGESPVIRSIESIWVYHGFAALLGVVWKPRGYTEGDLGLNHSTVRGACSQINAWHFEMHGIDLKMYGSRCNYVVRGLKKMAGPSLPLLHLSYRAFKFVVRWHLGMNTPKSIAIAHAIMWLFLGLFRVSEIAATNSHNPATNTERYLLNSKVTVIRSTAVPSTRVTRSHTPSVRYISWVLDKTKWKDDKQIRHLFATGCAADEADDIIVTDLTNDFANTMAKRQLLNEEYLRTHEHARHTLPFIHVNGEPLTSADIKTGIVDGIKAGRTSHSLVNPDDYRVGTHTCRRGGATYYSENGAGDKFLCWLGRWASVAWLRYVEITSKAVARVSGLVSY